MEVFSILSVGFLGVINLYFLYKAHHLSRLIEEIESSIEYLKSKTKNLEMDNETLFNRLTKEEKFTLNRMNDVENTIRNISLSINNIQKTMKASEDLPKDKIVTKKTSKKSKASGEVSK